MKTQRINKRSRVSPLYFVHGPWHVQMLTLFMVLVFFHFSEHLLQAGQAFVLQWPRAASGGLLGLWRPDLASSEVLHFAYNLFQLFGLVVLLGGFSGRARFWWKVAIGFQCWHFFEHALLQTQWLTKMYLYGANKQMSLLEVILPRIELHFIYNVLVMVPMLLALAFYIQDRRTKARHQFARA
jgi:hypothetical protein